MPGQHKPYLFYWYACARSDSQASGTTRSRCATKFARQAWPTRMPVLHENWELQVWKLLQVPSPKREEPTSHGHHRTPRASSKTSKFDPYSSFHLLFSQFCYLTQFLVSHVFMACSQRVSLYAPSMLHMEAAIMAQLANSIIHWWDTTVIVCLHSLIRVSLHSFPTNGVYKLYGHQLGIHLPSHQICLISWQFLRKVVHSRILKLMSMETLPRIHWIMNPIQSLHEIKSIFTNPLFDPFLTILSKMKILHLCLLYHLFFFCLPARLKIYMVGDDGSCGLLWWMNSRWCKLRFLFHKFKTKLVEGWEQFCVSIFHYVKLVYQNNDAELDSTVFIVSSVSAMSHMSLSFLERLHSHFYRCPLYIFIHTHIK